MEHTWIEMPREGHEYGGESLAIANKMFCKDGKEWPRISVSIYHDKTHNRLKITCEEKTEKGWWEKCSLPKDLLPGYIELLKEVYQKLNIKK